MGLEPSCLDLNPGPGFSFWVILGELLNLSVPSTACGQRDQLPNGIAMNIKMN